MDAVIPAAGEGTRLGGLASDRPKGLVEVGGRPLLEHPLRALLPLEPRSVVIVVGSGGGPIRERLGESFGPLPLRYAVQEEPTGLADAVRAAEPLVDSDELVVLNGDNVVRAELLPVVERRRREGLDAVLMVESVPAGSVSQGLCVVDEEERVVRLVEHPTEEDLAATDIGAGEPVLDPPGGPVEGAADASVDSAGPALSDQAAGRPARSGPLAEPNERLVAAGFYAFSRAVFDACRDVRPGAAGERELSDAINILLERGAKVAAEPLRGWRVNVNTPADLAEAERRLAAEG